MEITLKTKQIYFYLRILCQIINNSRIERGNTTIFTYTQTHTYTGEIITNIPHKKILKTIPQEDKIDIKVKITQKNEL